MLKDIVFVIRRRKFYDLDNRKFEIFGFIRLRGERCGGPGFDCGLNFFRKG